MKIGLLILRQDFQHGGNAVDARYYISHDRHEFETCYISKSNAEADIDEICRNRYDIFLNYMVGKAKREKEDVADHCQQVAESGDAVRVAAIIKYIEAKGVPLLNNLTGAHQDVKTSVVRNINGPNLEIAAGQNWFCLVMDMGLETKVFTPGQQVSSHCLDREVSHSASANFTFVTNAPLKAELESIALDLFKATYSGFSCIGIELVSHGDAVSLEGRICPPRVFSPSEASTYEDLVIKKEFPGGHMAFFDTLVASKEMRSGQDSDRNQHLASVYDGFAPRYSAARANTGLSSMQEDLSRDYDFSGTVLDLACGSGEFGAILHDRRVAAKITGSDLSQGMTQSSYIQAHYEQPLLIGPMDEVIMSLHDFDHVVCFAAFQFLDPVHLTAFLARMFMIAKRSVTAIHEDLTEAYIENMKKRNGELCTNFNHVSTLEDFGVPRGWKQVRMERFPLYDNPNLGETVYGFVVRFERL
ncbi:Major facilitator superfamily domain general substrate transporter [Penicillium cf. griseofulvum]|uniref:Major facilitator superfamily domain general substrate transporter n=1 Tax=Penicillium cf. griseofulvum TaxID=2972120 RepID=A0A9W9J1J4_9EURO|nr:Major facilitator superfamily domain general substrate transporter [Penicillium cf. griseofulvum]KAJ5422951.1 Major facilitator superfamily domain general substrate transporter [Penicillium cf. griseofulvum]KAJ5433832.1 Major facilitator superfamily domain general substrate transporter [Penicillium cf. griseofulvum]